MDTETQPLPTNAPIKKSSAGKWWCLGCGGCFGLSVLALAGVFGIVLMAFNLLKENEVYKTAVNTAQNSPEVQAQIGTPVEPGFWLSGSINYLNGAGTADLIIPIKGPSGKGSIIVKATQDPSAPWVYHELYVNVEGSSDPIDLTSSLP